MLLERSGDAEGGKVVREALEAFQREYAETHPMLRSYQGSMAADQMAFRSFIVVSTES